MMRLDAAITIRCALGFYGAAAMTDQAADQPPKA